MALHLFLSFFFFSLHIHTGAEFEVSFRGISLRKQRKVEGEKCTKRMCLLCFFSLHARLFVLRLSFGTNSAKVIINSVIESFSGPGLRSHLQNWSLFFFCYGKSELWEGSGMSQRMFSTLSGII